MIENGSTEGPARRGGRASGGDDRGLSDVVAFVLTFTIIIASMALVSTAGIDQLTQLRDSEQLQTADRAMQAAAEEINHLEDGDPFRILEFSLNDGDLWVNESTISVEVDNGTDTVSYSIDVNSLEHRFDRSSGDVSVAYESGAVVRSDGAWPSYEPDWYADDETAIVTLVNITTGDSIDAAGGYHRDITIGAGRNIPQGAPATDPDETLQIAAATNLSEDTVLDNRHLPPGEDATVTVDVSQTANPHQWRRYLERTGWSSVPGDDYQFQADVSESVLIREITIELW